MDIFVEMRKESNDEYEFFVKVESFDLSSYSFDFRISLSAYSNLQTFATIVIDNLALGDIIHNPSRFSQLK